MSPEPKREASNYESLFENSHSVMLIIEPETGEILDANRAAVQFYQYSKKELLKLPIYRINTLSPRQIKAEMEKARAQRRTDFNFRHQLKNGDIRDVEVHTCPIDFNGKKVLYSIIHDVTEKRQTRQRLRESESTVMAMINATTSLVCLVDLKMEIINLNTNGAKLFGKTPDEMIGKNVRDFFEENDFFRIKRLAEEVAQTRRPLNYQRDRDEKTFDVNLFPVFNNSGNVDKICLFANDITDLKKTEKVFAAIETAGGICHEMNQPLQVILGNLELLKLKTDAEDPNMKLIDAILLQTEKLGLVTKKLTNITRYQTKEYLKGTIFDIDRSTTVEGE